MGRRAGRRERSTFQALRTHKGSGVDMEMRERRVLPGPGRLGWVPRVIEAGEARVSEPPEGLQDMIKAANYAWGHQPQD